ncbi:MAG: S41 family peptidase [Terracidiphilus sp.]
MTQAIQDNYYDPELHGVDLKARKKAALDRLDSAHSLSDVYGIVAWMLEPLNDSHTFFIPPLRPYAVENGWRFGFVGDKPYITAVKPDSDAFAQGIRPGDELLSLEGYSVTHENSWKLQYAFDVLAPRSATHLVVRNPDGNMREVLANAHVRKLSKMAFALDFGPFYQTEGDSRLLESRVIELGDDLMIWKLPTFENDETDKYIRMAQKHKALILDLRGNPGGIESVLSEMIERLFDREVVVGDRLERKHTSTWKVESKHADKAFTGKLVVLTDSETASAAEVLARVVQIEGRGRVIGDRSSGMVMRAEISFFSAGKFDPVPLGVAFAVADLRMRDGKSLESVGVVPDRTVFPSPQDLAAGRDPVLAAAATELGHQLTAEEAGKLFPVVWREF